MATKPPKVCSTPGCPGLSKGGRCDECKKKHGTEKRDAPWRAIEVRWRNNSRWRGKKHGRRAGQLRREPLCRECARKGLVVAGTEADHVVPARGDYQRFWFGELQSLCRACHAAKTGQEE